MLHLYALPTMPVEEGLQDLDHCDTLSEPPVAGNNEVDILFVIGECFCCSSSQALVQQGQTFREAEVSHELVLPRGPYKKRRAGRCSPLGGGIRRPPVWGSSPTGV